MWTPDHRRTANRNGLRYPSDLTEAEWAIVEPMIPPARHGGRRRSGNVREVGNGIFYVVGIGGEWEGFPQHLHFCPGGRPLELIHHALYVRVRDQDGREPSPTSAIIDSQTAKGALKGGLRSILRATTRARRSKVANGTSWSTRWASC